MKSIWINLPVKDLQKSITFFKTIGFRENPIHEKAENLGSFFIGENDFVMMLFPEDSFKSIIFNEVSNTSKGSEFLLNIDAKVKKKLIKWQKL